MTYFSYFTHTFTLLYLAPTTSLPRLRPRRQGAQAGSTGEDDDPRFRDDLDADGDVDETEYGSGSDSDGEMALNSWQRADSGVGRRTVRGGRYLPTYLDKAKP